MFTDDAFPFALDDTLQNSLDESLEATEVLHDRFDQIGLGRSLLRAVGRAATKPARTAAIAGQYLTELSTIGVQAAEQFAGRRSGELPARVGRDRRFNDAVWRENPFFCALVNAHAAGQSTLEALVELADDSELDQSDMAKARFAVKLLSDALAPSNFFATNPVAQRRAFETGGLSIARGMRNFVTDLLTNSGWPRQVDTSPFTLGENMAATPGKVVYRNDLIELIQYLPQTERVRETPLLLCPPWINKYYIMDLAPSKSLIEFAVQQGFTCFAISYRNPDESMRDFRFDDYLLNGPLTAVDVVREITGAEKVNTLAVCLGGTLNTCMLAYLDAVGDDLVNTSTYLNCLNDFSGAGTLRDVFTDEATVDRLISRMEQVGYLDGKEMARTFDLLRANDLVFNYVVSNWLLGEEPPAFDLLAWNNDSTHMPAAMHGTYLKRCYIDNALAHDEMQLLGEKLVVTGIEQETYVVAAIDDHIVPWRASYKTTQLFKGESRFVLSSAGHIAGIVNPPGPRAKLWTNDATPADPDAWFEETVRHDDTWWNDWARWTHTKSGEWVAPPSIGGNGHAVVCDAPGTYVFG